MTQIPLLSPVALLEDVPGRNLTKGLIGTAVEYLQHNDERAILVEFSDDAGRTYAMVDLKPEQLIVLHRKTEAA
ncbi:MAG: DUF4926 domain-containing protein [Bryobacteraceae bacterium]